MGKMSSGNVTINNPADITIIVGYFIMVISVGIWVSKHDKKTQSRSRKQ